MKTYIAFGLTFCLSLSLLPTSCVATVATCLQTSSTYDDFKQCYAKEVALNVAKEAALDAAKAAYKKNSEACIPKCKPAFVTCFNAGTTLAALKQCGADNVACQKSCVDALGIPPQ